MKAAINHLNAVIEDRMPTALTADSARRALYAIETQQLAVTALRTLVTHNKTGIHTREEEQAYLAALAHAERFLKNVDEHPAHVDRMGEADAKRKADLARRIAEADRRFGQPHYGHDSESIPKPAPGLAPDKIEQNQSADDLV